jgi:glutathione S-transferase
MKSRRAGMTTKLKLISHKLCPYVQRAVIALTEKGVPFERIDIDLAKKPDWFLAVSPLGKTPVLQVAGRAIFESAVILEYLEETQQRPLHPADPLTRAEHRAWIEFGSTVLSDIAALYSAGDEATFKAKAIQLNERFARLEAHVAAAPWFDGEHFALVDAAFGPVFRYFDVFDEIADFAILADKPKLKRWRDSLAQRPSVRAAVSPDYPALLHEFLRKRNSWLSRLQARAAA